MSKELEVEFDVRGSEPISFSEGWQTGDMTESGVEIKTVWHSNKRSYGGCINREEATQLRDFLNECLSKWAKE